MRNMHNLQKIIHSKCSFLADSRERNAEPAQKAAKAAISQMAILCRPSCGKAFFTTEVQPNERKDGTDPTPSPSPKRQGGEKMQNSGTK